jgi:hypothetical protein
MDELDESACILLGYMSELSTNRGNLGIRTKGIKAKERESRTREDQEITGYQEKRKE